MWISQRTLVRKVGFYAWSYRIVAREILGEDGWSTLVAMLWLWRTISSWQIWVMRQRHLHSDPQGWSVKGMSKTSPRLEVAQGPLLATGRTAPLLPRDAVLCGLKQTADAASHGATRWQRWAVSRRMSFLPTLCHHFPQGTIHTTLAVSMTLSLREVAWAREVWFFHSVYTPAIKSGKKFPLIVESRHKQIVLIVN